MGTSSSDAAVLVVEDEWLIADQIAHSLRSIGYRVVGPAHRVAAAIELLGQETPQAALLDIALGRETSFGFADTLAERQVPFAFVSAYSRDELPPRFASRRILTKPFGEAELRREIEALL